MNIKELLMDYISIIIAWIFYFLFLKEGVIIAFIIGLIIGLISVTIVNRLKQKVNKI